MRKQVLALVCGVVLMVPAVSAGQQPSGTSGPLTVDRWWMPDGFDAASVTIQVNRLDTSRLTDVEPQPSVMPGPSALLESPGFGESITTMSTQSLACVDCDEQPVRSIPEPGVLLLLVGGLAALAVRRRRA